jgi:hypothetical protein
MSDIQAITYTGSKTVTNADSGTDPAGPFAGLLVTATGTLKFTTAGGDVVTLSSTSEGQVIPIATQLVWSTGTSATVLGLIGAGPWMGGKAWG